MNTILLGHKIFPTFQDDKIKLTSRSSSQECSIERYVLELSC